MGRENNLPAFQIKFNIMNRRKLLVLIICVCSLFSCKKLLRLKEKQIVKEEHIISIFPTEDDLLGIDFSLYLDSVKYVKLELTDESIIGQIDKVVIYDERIYIFDTQTSGLFVFDMDGHYLHRIARIGQGPEEYTRLHFFDIDRENRHIVLTDLMTSWIMRYDLNGNFLSRQKIPVWCFGASVLPNKGVVLYADFRDNSDKLEQEYNLLYLDSVMNIKQAFFPYNSKDFDQRMKPPVALGGLFYAFKDNLYFTFGGGNTVYQMTGDSLISKYQFDFGDDILQIENIPNPDKFTDRLKSNKYKGFLTPVMGNDQLLFFRMYPTGYSVYYSKESGNVLSTFMFLFDDLPFSSLFQTGYDSWIVSEIHSYNLTKTKDYMKFHKKTPINKYAKELLSLADESTEDDNPVLMFYKLKPF
jgi:hypothetical protein